MPSAETTTTCARSRQLSGFQRSRPQCAHAKLNRGQHSATILKTRPIYAPNTIFGIFSLCFYNSDLGAAILWRDRPGFGRFDRVVVVVKNVVQKEAKIC
jgi:hypothetical protein